ncbi:MAG: VWA domain-containing protein [Flavobacteriaceae bacterium]|nr:VWA domain-containing protein [Flavobacteriaceae bacterium]
MSTETILYIALVAVLAVVLAGYQYLVGSEKTRLRFILALIRAATYFLVGLLIVNPKWEQNSFLNEKPSLLVAIDNSESISTLGQTDQAREVIEALNSSEDIKERFDLSFFKFGDKLKPLDSLGFDERQSDINSVFKGLKQVYQEGVAPLVLVSDGNQTFGSDFEYGSKDFKHPIFPIILGDTISYSDLRIDQLNVNKYAFLKNRFPVEIFMSYSGKEAVSSKLQILSGSSVIYSSNLSFSEDNTSQSINLTLPANRVGVLSYSARIVPLNNEKNVVNNSKPFAVEVIDQKTNVALVSSFAHPDLGALKKAISSNEQRQVDILDPVQFLRKIEDYQLVIFYQPDSGFTRALQTLEENQSNLFIITGSKTQWRVLNGIQFRYEQEVTGQVEDYQPSLNDNYNNFIIEDLDFSSFPPLRSEFGELSVNIPYETILYKSLNGNVIEEPLMLSHEINGRREVLLVGENIWRWRAQSYLNDDSFNAFDNFIGKIVQYLASDKQRRRLTLDYESFYNGNSNITLTAQYFNKNFEFDNKANLEIVLRNKTTDQTQTIPFVIRQNNYQVDLSGLDPAEYSFTVSSTNGEASRSGSLTILDYNVEQQFLNANARKMNAIAEASGGSSFSAGEIVDLMQVLIDDSRFATIQKSVKKVVPLIDFKILLFLLALSLAAEWFTRKYNGLI